MIQIFLIWCCVMVGTKVLQKTILISASSITDHSHLIRFSQSEDREDARPRFQPIRDEHVLSRQIMRRKRRQTTCIFQGKNIFPENSFYFLGPTFWTFETYFLLLDFISNNWLLSYKVLSADLNMFSQSVSSQ